MSPNPTVKGPDNIQAGILKHRNITHSSNLYLERERLKTFDGWPSNAVHPKDLAANGFYYTKHDDHARCVFCGVEVGHWERGDSVMRDHKRYAPDCDFLRGRPCSNVPLVPNSEESIESTPVGYDTCGPHGHLIRLYSGPERACTSLPQNILDGLEQLGVSRTSGPATPRFSSEEARLRTFIDWPESCPVRPEALAEAGFYSTGRNDHALCFHCGGGLKDWETGDDPWVEHARWFSRCAFVQMHKGRDYVASVAQQKPAVMPAETMSGLLEQGCEEKPSEDVAGSSCEPVAKPDPIEPSIAESQCSAQPESALRDMELCKICYAKERAIVFLPCGHFVSCAMCASALSSCPVCRKPYEATVRAYLS